MMKTGMLLVAALAGFGSLAAEKAESELELTGGMVSRPAKGFVAVVDLQTSFGLDRFGELFFPRGRCLRIPYKIVRGERAFDVKTAGEEVGKLGANAAIFLIDDPTLPMSLASLEAEWAMVNMAKLTADHPNAETLFKRVDRMFSRATIQILGGGSFMQFPMSAMKRVNSLADLDQLPGRSPSPQAMMSMDSYMRELGIVMSIDVPYSVACEEGWAPAPTNDVQKVIWNHVHSIPSNPMKIEFDPKKGR